MATLFRGYEVIAIGRDPRDSIFITSRACGVCGGVHSVTSAMATEMALGIAPPPLGIAVRNLALVFEFLYDHPLHLFLLAGPDYSAQLVGQTNPSLLEKARHTTAPGAEVHGYRTVGDIMEDLNPLSGGLYLEALEMTRVIREAYVLICGKYPHPQTIVPGGMSTTVSTSTFNEVFVRFSRFFDYGKRVAAIWDDITDFFYEAEPRYRKVGERPVRMVDTGIFDHPYAYDATYENADEWGKKRWCTPGVVVDGELVTTDLHRINLGTEEFVEHSYYENWAGDRWPTDPAGQPLSPYHPWNEETTPKPTGQSWRERYSWAKSPRWDRMSMEAGCYSRMWNTAVAQHLESDFLEPTGDSLRMLVPKAELPEMELSWEVPGVWNAFERNRARAYCIPYMALIAMDNWMMGLEMAKEGKEEISTPFTLPRKGETRRGVGFWGAGRGWLTHHLELDGPVVANYQILTPSTWNASPQDPWGHPGPYEEAVLGCPMLEEISDQEDFKGIDILRTIRSFDPCMPCTTHIHTDHGVISREVTTCACGVEDEGS